MRAALVIWRRRRRRPRQVEQVGNEMNYSYKLIPRRNYLFARNTVIAKVQTCQGGEQNRQNTEVGTTRDEAELPNKFPTAAKITRIMVYM